MAYREALHDKPNQDNIEHFDGSVRTAIHKDHFFKEQHQHPNQQYQLPLESVAVPPPQPMMPPQISFCHGFTCVGRIVNLPDCYGFENQCPEVTMCNAPPRSPTPENHSLEGLEGCQWANLSVLFIEERKLYKQAKVSPQWTHWKKDMDDKLESLKENDVWDIIPKPVGRKIVASRWVFEAKGNAQGEVEHYKAQFVEKWFLQTLGQDYDELFAPVVCYNSLRI